MPSRVWRSLVFVLLLNVYAGGLSIVLWASSIDEKTIFLAYETVEKSRAKGSEGSLPVK